MLFETYFFSLNMNREHIAFTVLKAFMKAIEKYKTNLTHKCT